MSLTFLYLPKAASLPPGLGRTPGLVWFPDGVRMTQSGHLVWVNLASCQYWHRGNHRRAQPVPACPGAWPGLRDRNSPMQKTFTILKSRELGHACLLHLSKQRVLIPGPQSPAGHQGWASPVLTKGNGNKPVRRRCSQDSREETISTAT